MMKLAAAVWGSPAASRVRYAFVGNARPNHNMLGTNPAFKCHQGGCEMSNVRMPVGRRTVLKAGFALGASQVVGAPYVIKALGDEDGQTRHGQSAHRRAVGTGAK